jgi:hypothetical protein
MGMPMHICVTGLLNLIVGVLGQERLDQLLFSRGQHTSEADHEEITDQRRPIIAAETNDSESRLK